MATKREKNSGRQQRKERRTRFLISAVWIGLQVFLLLFYFTRLPINKPIDPEDTKTVTVTVTNTVFGEGSRGGGRHGSSYRYHFLTIYTDFETFRMEGPRNEEKSTETGAYNMLALNDVIQTGDTLAITYRQYYPFLIPQKYVVGICENGQIYRALDQYNESLDPLVDDTILLVVAELILLPITLFTLDVPQKIWQKAREKQRRKKKEAEKAAKEAKAKKGPSTTR